MNRFVSRGVVALILGIVLVGAGTSVSGGDPAVADPCAELRSVNLERLPEAPTVIETAETIAARDDVPEHCKVTGYVAPQVRFELLLPTEWNGDFFFGGCGGLCGAVEPWACEIGVTRGYASATTDTGHSGADPYGLGTTVYDALWAYGNESAVIDWAYRGVHVATVATKRITELYYERAPLIIPTSSGAPTVADRD